MQLKIKKITQILGRISITLFALILFIVNIYTFVYTHNMGPIKDALRVSPISTSQQGIAIELSGIREFFPDLRGIRDDELEPILLTGASAVRRKLMIGIPVAERKTDYSIATLASLFSHLDSEYRTDVVFLVMLASDDKQFVHSKAKHIRGNFSSEISEGQLEIIAVSPAWYKTNIHKIPPTLGDSSKRMYWRTKQNIDYVYIMTYASRKCEYYMQLEDDVTAAEGYARVIFNYIDFKNETDWFVMDFSWMGFIGKMFRAVNLKYMTYAIALYYKFKPVDWIIEDVLRSRYCSLDKQFGACIQEISKYRVSCGCSQFQHVGKISSLTGKIQKIHDGTFGKGISNHSRSNPPAAVESSMTAWNIHTPQRSYDMNVAMWLLDPKEGDFISIAFKKAVNITGILLLSGLPPAPKDKLGPEATVVAFAGLKKWSLGRFSPNGDFLFRSKGTVIEEIHINIAIHLNHWILIDHIYIEGNVTE